MFARCGIGADRGASGWRSGGPFGLVNHEPRVGLTDAKRRAALELYAGLDVSVAETSVCVVDADGKVIRETKVPTEPEAIIAALAAAGAGWKRVGLEAGPLSQWLFSALVEAGYPAICVETRHMKAALSARINKSDRNDARGIARMMRVGLYRPVHVKTLASQERRRLLTNRRLLQDKMLDIGRELRGTLRNFGLKVGVVSRARFEARVEELVTPHPRLAVLVRPLLAARRVLREQFALMHEMLLDLVRDEPVCRRLMTAPGVGAPTAAQRQSSWPVVLPHLRMLPSDHRRLRQR